MARSVGLLSLHASEKLGDGLIRLANEADIPLILRRLAELDNPPNDDEQSVVINYLDPDVVIVNTEHDALYCIHRDDGHRMITMRWLLPDGLGLRNHHPGILAALRETVRRWPDTAGWMLEGSADKEPQRKAEAWQRYLGTGYDTQPHVTVSAYTDRWSFWWVLDKTIERLEAIAAVSLG